MMHAAITVLTLWLALQTISPEATQHWNAAQHAEQQKQFDVAVKEYRTVTKLEPNFAGGFVSLGQAFMELRDFGSALAPLKHALEIDSNLLPAHQLLGYALLAEGYAAEAIPHLERVGAQDALAIDVTGCRYAEFYKELGEPELGFLLVCSGDFAMAEGFGGDVELTRTQTIMQGAPTCTFRYKFAPR